MTRLLTVRNLDKTFTMHLQNGLRLPVLRSVCLEVDTGECVVLGGPSGAGKSTILKMIYGNYQCDAGSIILASPQLPHRTPATGPAVSRADLEVDLASAGPRTVLAARGTMVGYVSQFLRCVPRVAAIDVVAEPLVERGTDHVEARERAAKLLGRLGIPSGLWSLPPTTFSGGEQQRINLARGFIAPMPLLLLDEPTASLDDQNRQVVAALIAEKKAAGVGILAIFHDQDMRERVADRVIDVSRFTRQGSALDDRMEVGEDALLALLHS
jgi:alpha-D-ribose 1-methylphosphonate 5-triphosphate synthase subunit PhnL